jgi:SAM-dependent methyltransferase
MDEVARFNRERWNGLVRAGVIFSRPWLDLDEALARKMVDPYHWIGDVKDKKVLCLAGGGGQQSVAFALLGAHTTVLDLSDEMLERDRQAARHYRLDIRHEQGDMRDLSRFEDDSFDVVWHAFSINFVPDPNPVFNEVARVLKPGGTYHTEFSNPFTFNMSESEWDGKGYPVKNRYVQGMEADDTQWDVHAEDGSQQQVEGPREFRHTLSTVLNGLSKRGFVFLGLWEEESPNPQAEPGTWDHFLSFCPPWFHLWMRYLPDLHP